MSKIEQVRQYLREHHIDALLLTNPKNVRYMTGFTGTSGIAVISQQDAWFITDFRYTEQATAQIDGYTIVEQEKTMEEELHKQFKLRDIQSLAFEQDYVTYAMYETYKNKFSINLVPTTGVIEQLRMVKTDEEIDVLREAGEIADKAFEHIVEFIRPGMKEIDVANELEMHMRSLGATSPSFDIIVASGKRSALPHGVASEKVIENGELVTMDFGALYKGYCSDITRTVAIGDISEQLREIYDIVLTSQEIGVEHIRPGMTGREADALTRDYIADKGYGAYFGHSTGHGIGLEVHEEPRLSAVSDTVLTKGMIVTVEPGIYLPSVGGCRIEDDLVMTETGNERLTTSTKELIMIK